MKFMISLITHQNAEALNDKGFSNVGCRRYTGIHSFLSKRIVVRLNKI